MEWMRVSCPAEIRAWASAQVTFGPTYRTLERQRLTIRASLPEARDVLRLLLKAGYHQS